MRFALLLAMNMGVRIAKRGTTLVLQPPGGGTRFAPDLMPLETRLLHPRGKQTAEQLASVFCHSIASPAGNAQVIGDDVLIQDRRPYLDRITVIADKAGL